MEPDEASREELALRLLCAEIDAELETIKCNFALASERVIDVREALRASIETRCDEIASMLVAARAAKVSALEAERVAADVALENLQCVLGKGEGDLIPDSELELKRRAACAAAQRLPRGPVTDCSLAFEVDSAALELVRNFGAVVTASPAAVVLELGQHLWPRDASGAYSSRMRPILAGSSLNIVLRVTKDAPQRLIAHLEAAAVEPAPEHSSLQRWVAVDAATVCPEKTCSLPVVTRLSWARHWVHRGEATGSVRVGPPDLAFALSLQVPCDATPGSVLFLRALSVCGYPVVSLNSPLQVATVAASVARGLDAPLTLADMVRDGTPCVSAEGHIYCPSSEFIYEWGPTGDFIVSHATQSLRLSHRTCASAFDDERRTLFLGDWDHDRSVVVAVDVEASPWAVRWVTQPGHVVQVGGMTVLPVPGILVVSACEGRSLHALHVASGSPVCPPVPAENPTYLAADPESLAVFADTSDGAGSFRVAWWQWDVASEALLPRGFVDAAGVSTNWRPLAIVPPAAGRRCSYLVVGTYNAAGLRVLSCPGCELVCEFDAPGGMLVWGLAADPAGSSLVVLDGLSRAAQVLPWPLPGMPELA
jgi:hypothetical protein